MTLRPQGRNQSRTIEADANVETAFAWKDTHRQLKHLTNPQLRWWRRQILKGIFKDPNPTPAAVPAVPIVAPGSEAVEAPQSGPSKPQRGQTLSRSYIPQPIPLDGTDYQTSTQPSLLEDIRIAYIFQAPMVRGRFDNNKAKQLGVPNGPIRGKLTAGQSIEIDDPENPGQKKVILPEDVVGAPQDGGVSYALHRNHCVWLTYTVTKAAIVLDVDAAHVDSLLQASSLQEYQVGGNKRANLVVHRITAAVARDPRYIGWASLFDEKIEVSQGFEYTF